jgi:YHS domain-containing protein
MSINEFIIRERIDNPGATLKQIGDKYNRSYERVRQILAKNNLPTRHCRTKYHPKYICNQCHQVIDQTKTAAKLFCSPECKQAFYLATLECDGCGKLFQMEIWRLKRKIVNHLQEYFFCSRRCRGRIIGLKYGFAAHPENGLARLTKNPPKWAKFLPQMVVMYRNGQNINHIMKALGIPRGSSDIIKRMIHKNISSIV